MQTKQNKNPQGIQHVPTTNIQQPAARQQSHPKPSLNGGWQNDGDMEERKRMITNMYVNIIEVSSVMSPSFSSVNFMPHTNLIYLLIPLA